MVQLPHFAIPVIFGLSLCIGQTLFAFILLLRSYLKDGQVANIYLAVFMCLLCSCLSLFFLFDLWIVHLPHFILSFIPLLPGIPVTLFLYAKSISFREKRCVTTEVLLHLIPCFIIFTLLLPFFTLPGIEKIEWQLLTDDSYIEFSDIQQFTLSLLWPLKIFIVLHGLAYFYAITRILKKYQIAVRNTYSYTEGINFRWLQILVYTGIGLYLIYPTLKWVHYGSQHPFYLWVVSIFSGCIVLSLFSYFGVTQKRVGENRIEPSGSTSNVILLGEHSRSPQGKYKNSALSESAVLEIESLILEEMKTRQPYRDPQLSVKQLADGIALSVKDVSRVINERIGKNFMEFINAYRIADAKNLLANDITKNIIEIVFEVGFNSKTAFYEAFKKETGLTPTAFRKQNQKSA